MEPQWEVFTDDTHTLPSLWHPSPGAAAALPRRWAAGAEASRLFSSQPVHAPGT